MQPPTPTPTPIAAEQDIRWTYSGGLVISRKRPFRPHIPLTGDACFLVIGEKQSLFYLEKNDITDTQLAQPEDSATLNLRVVSSGPTLGVEIT